MFKVWSVTIILLSIAILVVAYFAFPSPSHYAAVIAVLALAAANFRDEIHAFYLSPCMAITAAFDSGHLYEVGSNASGIEKQVWFSAIARNAGWGTAKNVTVIFNGIESNVVENFGAYRGLALRRAWTDDSEVRAFHRGLVIPYGFCSVKKNSPDMLNFAFTPSTPERLTSIRAASGTQAVFEFEVVVVGDNIWPKKRIVRFSYDGNYLDGFKNWSGG